MNSDDDNLDYIECWNSILVPKWNRFRHLLSGNGAIHSDIALPKFGLRPGERVLDIGCGYGETCLDIARLVGPRGEVHGVDCTDAFLAEARREMRAAGVTNVRYELGDAQHCTLPHGYYDAAFSRFGVMFFQSVVAALRNVHTALKPGGRVCLIVWRRSRTIPAGARRKRWPSNSCRRPVMAPRRAGRGRFPWRGKRPTAGHAQGRRVCTGGPVRAHRCGHLHRARSRRGHRLPDSGRDRRARSSARRASWARAACPRSGRAWRRCFAPTSGPTAFSCLPAPGPSPRARRADRRSGGGTRAQQKHGETVARVAPAVHLRRGRHGRRGREIPARCSSTSSPCIVAPSANSKHSEPMRMAWAPMACRCISIRPASWL